MLRLDQRLRLIFGVVFVIVFAVLTWYAPTTFTFVSGAALELALILSLLALMWEIKTGLQPPTHPVAGRRIITMIVAMTGFMMLGAVLYPLFTSMFGLTPEAARRMTIVTTFLIGIPIMLGAGLVVMRWRDRRGQ